MTDYLTTGADLTSVANAIRAKAGTNANLVFPSGFISALGDIDMFINVDNVLATYSTYAEFTATEDCWVVVHYYGGTIHISINNNSMVTGKVSDSGDMFLPVKKGQTCKIYQTGNASNTGVSAVTVYGIN